MLTLGCPLGLQTGWPVGCPVAKSLLAALALCLPCLAQAQFQKTPWQGPTPAIEFQDTQGQSWTTAKLKGRTVVLNFWATWCAPCKEELPSLQTLHELGGGDPVVIGVNVRETASHVARYMRSTDLQLPVVLDPKGDTAKRWGVNTYPTTVLIDPKGQARWRVVGLVDWTSADSAQWLTGLKR